ncbi:MAG: phosphopantetheine-binding protein [Bacteroidota bacterium]
MENISSDELKNEIKELILDTLKITDVKPEDIENDAPLFGEGNRIGLYSIDSIEIIMALQRKYQVRIDDQNMARFVLQSIDSIAEFIIKEKEKQD